MIAEQNQAEKQRNAMMTSKRKAEQAAKEQKDQDKKLANYSNIK